MLRYKAFALVALLLIIVAAFYFFGAGIIQGKSPISIYNGNTAEDFVKNSADTSDANTSDSDTSIQSENTSAGNTSTPAETAVNNSESTPPSEVEDKPKILKITAVGDVMLGRGVESRLKKGEKGYDYPFEKVAGILKEGDIIFGNLEQPITDSTECLDAKYKYIIKSGKGAYAALIYAGFNLLSLANNHIMDYYDTGLFDTMDILEQNGIFFSGAGRNLDEARKPAIIEKKGFKVGMLAYTDMAELYFKGNPSIKFAADDKNAGVAPRKIEYIKEDMEKLRQKVDILIISLHWGVEESFDILPEQVEFAHSLIDMGADMVLGHHPHQFQGIEVYKGKLIAYSLGNFIFDQNDPENQESFIVSMEFEDKILSKLCAIPVRTVNKTQVVPVIATEAQEMLERQCELSTKLGSICAIEDGRLVFKLQ